MGWQNKPPWSCQPEDPCPPCTHLLLGCHPCNQQPWEQHTEFTQTPRTKTYGFPALSVPSQALSRHSVGATRLDESALALATPPFQSSPAPTELQTARQQTPHEIYQSQITRSNSEDLSRKAGLAKSLQTSSVPSLRYLSPGTHLQHSTITL